MKYISLDIETTGLDKNKNQIVEVGAVLDEIGSTTPIEELPKFRAVLLHDEIVMGSYCANLHRDLWAEILHLPKIKGADHLSEHRFLFACVLDKGRLFVPTHHLNMTNKTYTQNDPWTFYCYPEMFETLFNRWLSEVCPDFIIGRSMKTNINVAGKNPGTFDIPFLEALPGWQGLVKFHRRVLDPASHCILPEDEHIPDLQECLKRCGLEGTVQHTAVDDAIDIIRVIRQQRIGESVQRSICGTCIMPGCTNGDETLFNCIRQTSFTAEESACHKCDAGAVCGYISGRDPEKPCHRFSSK